MLIAAWHLTAKPQACAVCGGLSDGARAAATEEGGNVGVDPLVIVRLHLPRPVVLAGRAAAIVALHGVVHLVFCLLHLVVHVFLGASNRVTCRRGISFGGGE